MAIQPKLAYLTLQQAHKGQASFTHVREIISSLKKQAMEVTLFEPPCQPSSRMIIFHRLWIFMSLQFALWWFYFTSSRFHMLYIRSHFATWPSVVLAKFLGIVVVQEVNGTYEDWVVVWPFLQKIQRLFKWLIFSQLNLSTLIITVTLPLKEWLVSEGIRGKILVISNGANEAIFHPQARLTSSVPPYPYVVFFGALSPWQGIDSLLEASQSSFWPKEVHLLIFGDGKEREKVEQGAKESPQIHYLGTKTQEELAGWLSYSLASVIPKTDKNRKTLGSWSPLKLFESMACGIPTIVTDFLGQGDLVEKYHCGIVVEKDNPEVLAKAVARLYHCPREREAMGKRAREAVLKEFSWQKKGKETYNGLLQFWRKPVK